VLTPSQVQDLNQRLLTMEELLTDERGLPKRPWFRHQIYAPGYYTGYGVKTLPGVREAIEEREFDIVDAQIGQAAEAIDRVQRALDELTQALQRPIT
jgi:N-acetylated-alpha-linked acidic dipeptidase